MQPPTPVQRNFANLPTELQLHILLHIPTEKELLHFRLVSSLANRLVLEPVFWRTITFSKQLSFSSRRKPVGHATHSLAMTGAQPAAAPPLITSPHNSDAHLFVHRPSSAHPLSSTVSSHGPAQDSSTYADQHAPHPGPAIANPTIREFQASLSEAPGIRIRTWTMMEDSFLAFISRLASVEHAALGVHTIAIEDWEHTESLKTLWSVLQRFRSLRDLSIRNSCLPRLWPATHGSTAPSREDHLLQQHQLPWESLTRLDLKGCKDLQDLSGIPTWMPNVQTLNLEGCLAIESFLPLTAVALFCMGMDGPRRASKHLELTSLTLIHTNVKDEELIELLSGSPDLEELRLDQCYRLTAASLEAIGRGPSRCVQDPEPAAPQAGTHWAGESLTPLDPVQPSTVLSPADPGTATPSIIAPSSPCCPKLKVLSLRNCYDLADEGVRALAGCRQLEFLIIRGLRHVDEGTVDWLHSQGVPLRRALSPLGHWRHWLPSD